MVNYFIFRGYYKETMFLTILNTFRTVILSHSDLKC